MEKLIDRVKVKKDSINPLVELFKQVSTFTANLNAPKKLFLEEDPDDLSNYISNCSLTFIGSFALDCMHQDKLSIDAALIFQGGKIL